MSRIMEANERFKQYELKRKFRIGINFIGFINALLLLITILLGKPNIFILLVLIVMVLIVYKNKELRDTSYKEIIEDDCDAELWRWYFENKSIEKNRKKISYQIHYINALNLVGEKEKVSDLLKDLNFLDRYKKKDELFISYLMVVNDHYFRGKQLDSLYDLREFILNQTMEGARKRELLGNIAFMNNCYISALEKNKDILAHIERKVSEKISNLTKMKLLYPAYLLAINLKNEELERRYGDLIIKNGGTLYFVDEVSKIRKEIDNEKSEK